MERDRASPSRECAPSAVTAGVTAATAATAEEVREKEKEKVVAARAVAEHAAAHGGGWAFERVEEVESAVAAWVGAGAASAARANRRAA